MTSVSRRPDADWLAKVPEIGVLFWVLKVLSTGMGESASDYLARTNLVLGGIVGIGGISLALWLQLRRRDYHAPTYWFAVCMVAVSGTIAADVLHRFIGLPYWLTSAVYAFSVTALFMLWHRVEGTLSIHSITTPRREAFYWATVLATFALGTAVGDLTAVTLHLGFFASGVLFLIAIAVPLVAWRLGVSSVLTFWVAYVLTRPLGASFADWFGKPHSFGAGLGYGDGPVTALLIVAIAALVAYVAVTRNDIQPVPAAGQTNPDRAPQQA